jgi:molecular chaperone DnaK (HSP70)
MNFTPASVDQVTMQRNTFPFTATYVGKIKIDPKYKVVVGMDIGTTYSGVSIVARDNPGKVNCGAPSATNARDETKEPTVLLKTPGDQWFFGNKALHEYNELVEKAQEELLEIVSDESVTNFLRRKGVALFRHFKMRLKDKTQGLDTLTAKSTFGDPYSLLDLMTKTLVFLSNFALSEIQMGWLGALNITSEHVLWVVTVPAIWNDFGKSFMRKAAFQAGLISEESSDQLLLALEPESAAIAVHGEGNVYGKSGSPKGHSSRLFEEGVEFLVLDIGGGTVDITIHRVATAKPLVLDEITQPQGGPWGGIFVDQEFKTFLKRFFGTDIYERLQKYHPIEISEIMDQFKFKKENFDPQDKKQIEIAMGLLYSDEVITSCVLPSLKDLVQRYNDRPGTQHLFDLKNKKANAKMDRAFMLSLPKELMISFFEPTLVKICTQVKRLLKNHTNVSFIAVVGGYGSSPVVAERIRSAFGGSGENARKVIIPDGSMRPQAAVVHGAAYFGLYTSVIGSRIARYTFGVGSNMKWHEGCGFPESEACWDEKLREKRVKDNFSVLVKKGDSISPFQKFESKGFKDPYKDSTALSFPVFTSSEFSPKKTTEKGCTRHGEVCIPCKSADDTFDVYFTFGVEVKVEVVRNDNERRSTIIAMDP